MIALELHFELLNADRLWEGHRLIKQYSRSNNHNYRHTGIPVVTYIMPA